MGGKSRKTGQISRALIERLKKEQERGRPGAPKKPKCGSAPSAKSALGLGDA